jgi:hypothetical protein
MNAIRLIAASAALWAAGHAKAQEIVPPAPGAPAPGVPTAGAPGAPAPLQVEARQQGGNVWFDSTNKDLGTFYGTGEGVGTFKFKNPRDKVIEWRQIAGSCQCTKATIRVGERTYELVNKPERSLRRVTKVAGQPDQIEVVQQIAVEAGAEGEVDVHLDMTSVTGGKQATITIHSTDEALSQMLLNVTANGAQMFVISPTEVNLNKMTWSETREFTVTVTSPMHKAWNIVRMDDAKAFDVKWEKAVANDLTTWTIRGKYGPVDADIGGGGMLRFYTDVANAASFSVRVMATVQGPLEVKPGGFVPLGLVRKGTSAKKEVVFEPNDGFDLVSTALKFEKLSVAEEFITATTRKDGTKLVVELAVSDQAPVGMLKGDLVVELNHPLVKERRIVFNGFVR